MVVFIIFSFYFFNSICYISAFTTPIFSVYVRLFSISFFLSLFLLHRLKTACIIILLSIRQTWLQSNLFIYLIYSYIICVDFTSFSYLLNWFFFLIIIITFGFFFIYLTTCISFGNFGFCHIEFFFFFSKPENFHQKQKNDTKSS